MVSAPPERRESFPVVPVTVTFLPPTKPCVGEPLTGRFSASSWAMVISESNGHPHLVSDQSGPKPCDSDRRPGRFNPGRLHRFRQIGYKFANT